MANYQNLKAAISAAIKTNGNQEITGQVLQNVLNSIVSVIGANYTFAGVATPATNPGTPDQNVMYLAMEGGTYTNFNGTVLPAGISLLMWNGSWTSETVMYGDGGVFDISVYKSSGGTLATYADLSAALDGGNNIPASARKGGMSVKFVCSSDNKYVQARCISDEFTIDITKWQIEDLAHIRNRVCIPNLRNGSTGNPGNSFLICTAVIPTYGNKYIKITTDRPNEDGCHYAFSLALSASVSDLDSTKGYSEWDSQLYKVDMASDKINNIIDISRYPSALGISITIGEYDSFGNLSVLRITDFEKYTIKVEYFDELISIERSTSICLLRNGSAGNMSNPDVVCTNCKAIYGSSIYVVTNRPNRENCEYRYGFCLTSSAKDLGSITQKTVWYGALSPEKEFSFNDNRQIFDISSYQNAVGVCFVIAEYNTTSKVIQPLRISDFDGYVVSILSTNRYTEGIKDFVEKQEMFVEKQEMFLPNPTQLKNRLRNGSQGNYRNAWVVTMYGNTTQPIPVIPGHYYRVYCNRPTQRGYNYYYLLFTYSSLDGNTLNENFVRNESTGGETPKHLINESIYIKDGEVGLSVQITEAIGPNVEQQVGNVNALRTTDFNNYQLIITDVTDAYIPEENGFLNKLKNSLLRTKYGTQIADYVSMPVALRNGSGGNMGNTSSVTTSVIPTYGSRAFYIETNRPNSTGCSYRYGLVLTASKDDIRSMLARSDMNGPIVAYRDYGDGVNNSPLMIFTQDEAEQSSGFNVTLAEYNDTNQTWNPLRVEDFDGYYVRIVICSKGLDTIIDSKLDDISNEIDINKSVINRNVNKRSVLSNACRINKDSNGSKDFQMLIITDTHNENRSVENAVNMTNWFNTIDCMIHCGDITDRTYSPSQIGSCISKLSLSEKPWFVVVGNHDVGNTMKVYYGATHKEVYESLVKPMVDAQILSNGEYTINVPYYYHDFASRKIRLIVVYEYQAPLDIADNEYWEEVAYDSTKPLMEMGTTYTYDSGNPIILNCSGYTGGSFRLKKTVTTVAGQYVEGDTTPNYKVGRADRVIMQDQAQWFINTLLSTPVDYGIIVATHNPSMINSTNQPSRKFAVSGNIQASSVGQYSMVTDLLSEIINAYINKTTLSLKVVMGASGWHGSSATYLNTLNDGGVDYCYALSADFTNRNNSYFAGYVAGHAHRDLVFKHNTYAGQYNIAPICGITERANNASNDVARPRTDDQSYDAITVISVKKNRIALSRFGNDRTINGDMRDFEVINTAE